MAQISVPSTYLEPGGGGGIFPEGWFKGVLETPGEGVERIRTVPWNDAEKRLSLRFGQNEAIDDNTADPGNQKAFFDLPVEIDGWTFHNVENAPDNIQRALSGSLRRLTQLAVALGFTAPNGSGPIQYDVDAFVQSIVEGVFDGQTVLFETYHRDYTNRDGEEKTAVNLRQFADANA